MTEITSHDFRLLLSPAHGGSVDALQWRGHDLLFPTREPATGPTDRASFPLVPFAGRITGSEFSFEDRTVSLTPNFPPEPNVIHGFGWHLPWQISAKTKTSITLTHSHQTPEWPASYIATQTFRLTETAMELEMALVNTGENTMPAGLGWHPYFAAKGAHVASQVSAIWRPENGDHTRQPEALEPKNNLNTEQLATGLSLDHCFTSTKPETTIRWPDRNLEIKMTASDIFGHFVIYTPKDEAYFCAEPISHVPDAINLPNPPNQTGFRTLAPSEMLSGTIRLEPSFLGQNVR